MHRHPRPTRLSLRMLALLVLLALGLVMQPLVTSLGELHGALAHGEGVSALHGDHVGAPHLDASRHAEPDMAHALLHVVHCCGHAQAMLLDDPVGPLPPVGSQVMPLPEVRSTSIGVPVELRPPIRA